MIIEQEHINKTGTIIQTGHHSKALEFIKHFFLEYFDFFFISLQIDFKRRTIKKKLL